ncbi:MAG: serine hydrolase, partial [Victivallales bacterium]|nr:serine hydrolase [Victivallales bacterium]
MKKLLFALFAVVLLASCCSVQSERQCKRKCTSQCEKSCKIVDSGTTFAKETFQQYIDSGEIPGVVCVFYDNGVQETACLGYADFRDKRPITMDDVFQQCSQTKGFCGVTIAMLVEEGKLSLDDPVSKYLPEYKELWIQENNEDGSRKLVKAKNTLTVRMCLNHTGGFGFELPNWTNMGGWSRRMPLRSVAAMAAAFPLRFEPGTQAQYSNVGIDVGAAIVEVVSGQRWEQFLQERIFDPLGMTSSTFWPTDEQLARKVEIFRYHQ